ncbi:replication/maintenance protein RepL [Achromobacter xylosoxidans]|uniref:replication/maintenance protein RepL n=1 Tax=Achromobacter sp. TaxID=134375 RepID=UPI00258A2543|nr:replication/maintenance protein RepL [Achromobacter sp.]
MRSEADLKRQIVDNKTGEVLTERELPKNHNFVMFFREEMKSIRALAAKDPKAFSILFLMTEQMGENNSLVVSRETLAELLEFSLPTVDRKLKYLRENNFISVVKSGNMNIYLINARLAWTTYANNRRYAEFKATVLISESEQKDNHAQIKKTVNKKITVV